MGMNFLHRNSSSTACQSREVPRPDGDPNPHLFNILEVIKEGDLYLVSIVYPDCRNFEGHKLLVMNRNPEGMTVIDPHFEKGGYIVARFAPTIVGKKQAAAFMRTQL